MYKNLSLEEISSLKTSFFKNLAWVLNYLKYNDIKTLINSIKPYEKEIILLKDQSPFFRIETDDSHIIFRSDADGIQLDLPKDKIIELHRKLTKTTSLVASTSQPEQDIISSLEEKFKQWEFRQVAGKPFLVYDVETLWAPADMESIKYQLGYAILSTDEHMPKLKYKLVGKENLQKFVDYMIGFDWWVVGFNNISFDNRVVVVASAKSPQELEVINQKSLDLFLFVRRLTWRRLGLDKIASALIGVKKTLSSWLEGEKLLLQYQKTGDARLLQKVKNYCKNDVRMTLWILLYFLSYGKLAIDGKNYSFGEEELLKLGTQQLEQADEEQIQTSLF